MRGSRLEQVATILFHGGRGRADDVEVHAESVSERNAVAVVPEKAHSGKLTLRDRYGNAATIASRLRIADALAPVPVDIAPASRFFFAARRKPISFDVPETMPVEVQLSSPDTGELVKSWTVEATAGLQQGRLGRPHRHGNRGRRKLRLPSGERGERRYHAIGGDTGQLLLRGPPLPDPRSP